MKQFSVRVIIPYYSGEKYIAACLESLSKSDYPIEEIIIVDNSPDSFEVKQVPNMLRCPVLIVKAKVGIGFGRACNIGIDNCLSKSTKVLVLLNQDACLEASCIRHLVQALLVEPNVFAAAPLSLTYDGKDILDQSLEFYLLPHTDYIKDLVLGRVKNAYAVPFGGINAACLALSAQELKKTSFFDPLIHMYGEERDLLSRAQTMGMTHLFVPLARIRHAHTNFSSERSLSIQFKIAYLRGEAIRRLKKYKGFDLLRPRRSPVQIRNTIRVLGSCQRNRIIPTLGSLLRMYSGVFAALPKILSHRKHSRLKESIVATLQSDSLHESITVEASSTQKCLESPQYTV